MQYEFGGTERLYSKQGLKNLEKSTVTIIGVGGVGSWVAEALARTAVGKLILIDLDELCVTNTNRQIHALKNNVGKLKVEVLADRIGLINANCKVEPIVDFVTKNNLDQYLSIPTDFVVDAIDSARTKAWILYYCKRNKIKALTIGGAGGQIDPLKITVADLSRSWQDPLSAKVRNELRRNHHFSKNPQRRFGIDCVFSTEQLRYPEAGGNVSYKKPTNPTSSKLDCASGLGASVVVTATFGMVAAAKVINYLSEQSVPSSC